jgi:hypothetical protein
MEGALRVLKQAVRLAHANPQEILVSQNSDILLNMASISKHLGRNVEALISAELCEQACSQAMSFVTDPSETSNQMDLLLRSLVLQAEILEQDFRFRAAFEAFRMALKVLNEHFRDSHPM